MLAAETLDKLKKLVKKQAEEQPTVIVKSKSLVRGRKADRGGSASAAQKKTDHEVQVIDEPRKESPKKKNMMKASVS